MAVSLANWLLATRISLAVCGERSITPVEPSEGSFAGALASAAGRLAAVGSCASGEVLPL